MIVPFRFGASRSTSRAPVAGAAEGGLLGCEVVAAGAAFAHVIRCPGQPCSVLVLAPAIGRL